MDLLRAVVQLEPDPIGDGQRLRRTPSDPVVLRCLQHRPRRIPRPRTVAQRVPLDSAVLAALPLARQTRHASALPRAQANVLSCPAQRRCRSIHPSNDLSIRLSDLAYLDNPISVHPPMRASRTGERCLNALRSCDRRQSTRKHRQHCTAARQSAVHRPSSAQRCRLRTIAPSEVARARERQILTSTEASWMSFTLATCSACSRWRHLCAAVKTTCRASRR